MQLVLKIKHVRTKCNSSIIANNTVSNNHILFDNLFKTNDNSDVDNNHMCIHVKPCLSE